MLSEWDEDVFLFPPKVISTLSVYEDLRLLFRTYGWPHNFNHTSFDSAYSRWREFLAIKNHACDSASDIMNQKFNLDSVAESLNAHSRRVRMRVWGRNPDKDPKT
ncbi:hypothetical protein EAF00_005058 [Botryotinia globosa]|nr:hypothetical protein EAF00_005058 [Botryotinia globosa]